MTNNNVTVWNNNVEIFYFNGEAIRTVKIKGEPWFVVSEVCEILGFRKNNGSFWHVLRAVDEKETTSTSKVEVAGLPKNRLLISESGLYKLAMRSDKETAKPFQNWVTQVVLPAIRKDGGYILGEEKHVTGEMSDEELLARAAVVGQRKIERLQTENNRLSSIVNEHLEYLTVDEYRALNHLYLTKSYKTRLGQVASAILRGRGLPRQQQTRHMPTKEGVLVVTVNVYPRPILAEASKVIGLEAGHLVH